MQVTRRKEKGIGRTFHVHVAGCQIFVLILSMLLSACEESETPKEASNDTDTTIHHDIYTDTTVLENGFIRNVEATVSEAIPTVVTVQWTTEAPATGFVAYGPDHTMDFSTPEETEPDTVHKALLLGLTSKTDVDFRITVKTSSETITSPVHSVTTGPLRNGLPVLAKEGDKNDFYTIFTIIGPTTVVAIVDGSGEYVWYHIDDRELDNFRARLSSDGTHILYNAATVAGDPDDPTELVRVSLDGTTVTTVPLPLLAHDFVEHPNGTIGAIVTEYREINGDTVQGNRIVEIDSDGNETEIWNAWSCFDPALHQGDDTVGGWTFANALDFDPVEDVYYIGMRNFSSIAKIERATGECAWVLGSTAATLTFADDTRPFLHQHQFQVRDNTILILDNDGPLGHSRAVEYALDLSNGTATEIWSYVSDPPLTTYVLGEPTHLDNGDIFVNWSAAGIMERVSSDGTSKWRLISSSGSVFGFHTIEKRLYRSVIPLK